MVTRIGVRRTAVACLGGLALLIATGTACSPEPLSVVTTIDFSGEWVLSDSVSGLVQGEEVPPRVCKTWDRPMHLWLYVPGNTYGVVEQFGGTVSCRFDGVFEEPRMLSGTSRSFFLEVGADSIILRTAPGYGSIRYKATTISADRLAGTVYLPVLGIPDDHADHGTWEMIRSH